jgi:acylphosphatase
MVRAHIHFHGTVQGVGFRYTTLSFAQELMLTGWVKNLPDGTVEAVVEGARPAIEKLITRLKAQFRTYLRDTQVDWLNSSGDFISFSII